MLLIVNTLREYTVEFFNILEELNSYLTSTEKLVLASKLVANNLDKFLYEGINDNLLNELEGYLFALRHKGINSDYKLIYSFKSKFEIVTSYRTIEYLILIKFSKLRNSSDILDQSKYRILLALIKLEIKYK